MKIKIHEIAKDGLPPKDGLVGRVAFIWDSDVFMGWPLDDKGEYWEAAANQTSGKFAGVTHWIEFPEHLGKYS